MSPSDAAQLKATIATATRAVEYARRVANSDETKLEMFINHLHTLSELRVDEGEFMRAESLLREASFRIEEAQAHHRMKPNPLLAANVASSMGFLYDRWGKADKAREHYERCLSLAAAGGFLETDLGGSVSNNLGMIEKKAGNVSASEIHYRAAHRILQGIKGADSQEAAAVLNNLGVLLYSAQRQEEALETHTAALHIRQKHFDPITAEGEGDLRQTWQNLAAVHKARGDHEKAASLLRQAGLAQPAHEASTVSWIVNNFREAETAQFKSAPAPTVVNSGGAAPAKTTAPGNIRAGFKVEVFDID